MNFETAPPAGVENQENNFKAVREQILKLKGVDFTESDLENFEGLRLFSLSVKNRKAWESAAEKKKLVALIGEMAFDAFEPREGYQPYDANNPEIVEGAGEAVEGNVQPADRVYLIADQEKALGFLAAENWPMADGTNACYVHLVSVDRSRQNQQIGKELYRQVFEAADVSAFVGISFRPQAVQNRLKIGQEFGYDGFFCNFKNGEWGNQPTSEEQVKLDQLRGLMVKKSEEWKILVKQEMIPPGYIIWDGEQTMSPLKEEELDFPAGDQLDKTFREGLVKLQEKCAPDVAFGLLVNLRKNLDQNDQD